MTFGSAQRKELKQLLRQFRAAHSAVALPSGTGKALEAWVMMKMADAAAGAGWQARLHDGSGNPLASWAEFKFRTQGGKIACANPAAVGYVALEAPDGDPAKAQELHGGVRWKGRSAATHELDISMVPAVVGIALRGQSAGGHPRGLPHVAIECKDKGQAGNADEMRETLARLFDLACVSKRYDFPPHRIFDEHKTTGWSQRLDWYRDFFESGQFGIVRALGFQFGANQLGLHYHIVCYPNIYQRSAAASMNALLDRFREVLASIA